MQQFNKQEAQLLQKHCPTFTIGVLVYNKPMQSTENIQIAKLLLICEPWCINRKLRTNYVQLYFVLIHCMNSYARALNRTEIHINWCSARRENVGPTRSCLPSLSKYFRLIRSLIEFVSCRSIHGERKLWTAQNSICKFQHRTHIFKNKSNRENICCTGNTFTPITTWTIITLITAIDWTVQVKMTQPSLT